MSRFTQNHGNFAKHTSDGKPEMWRIYALCSCTLEDREIATVNFSLDVYNFVSTHSVINIIKNNLLLK